MLDSFILSGALLQNVDWGNKLKLIPFWYRKYERDVKHLMFLKNVNNIEHNIIQNIYTGMVAWRNSLLYLHGTVYKNS